MALYVILEYPEPTSPEHRKLYEPVKDLGHVEFEATPEEYAAFVRRLGAASQFRAVPKKFAVDCGLLREDG